MNTKRSQPLYFITATLLFLLSFTTNVHATSGETNTQIFTLQLWAPDEVPPPDAKHVEIGEGYYYRYTPEAVSFTDNTNRKVKITFDTTLASRYQFRWVTATSPGDVTLEEKTNTLMRIAIDDGNDVADDIYLEVWVFDTQTGERFMCDPQIQNKPV
ncbi:hypothetical protein [Alteromonas australica]|uniref:Uncharacterized protein n=1 Tax=Alteromonas australica TaxID=589873 RepID=A0A075NXL7_9ALTE|nr:hypothetical protein [Alteromonas australica]AIF99419.1 hypothetical protein EP13_12390 [Alteromonas australica]